MPKDNRRNSKSKLRIKWRVLKKASRKRSGRQRRKLPRSTSGLNKRSRRLKRRPLKPLPKLRREPKKLRIGSIWLI